MGCWVPVEIQRSQRGLQTSKSLCQAPGQRSNRWAHGGETLAQLQTLLRVFHSLFPACDRVWLFDSFSMFLCMLIKESRKQVRLSSLRWWCLLVSYMLLASFARHVMIYRLFFNKYRCFTLKTPSLSVSSFTCTGSS